MNTLNFLCCERLLTTFLVKAQENNLIYLTSNSIISITFVFVGPVTIWSFNPLKTNTNYYRQDMLLDANLFARVTVTPSAMAPAASVFPSIPSVPALRTTVFSNPLISICYGNSVKQFILLQNLFTI